MHFLYKRREFITLLGGATAAWPLAARAQSSSRVRLVGGLIGLAERDPEAQVRVTAFRHQLAELGWVDGKKIRFEFRFFGGNSVAARTFAADLVGLAPDVIWTLSVSALDAISQTTHTIPVVFVSVADPVGSGFVASLSRPGGNITGFTNFEYAIGSKWLQTLKDIAPSVTRVVILHGAETSAYAAFLSEIERAAPLLGLSVTAAGVHNNAAEIERVITAYAREPNGGLIVLPHPITTRYRGLIIELTSKYHLPAIHPYRYFAAEGGLISYGVDALHLSQQAALYVDRILNGAKPADLPVQQPAKFDFVVNLKTAKALGLTVPPTLLARADEVIE
jgi:putative tryptophan/tyrosine transport system substrate-binding protein